MLTLTESRPLCSREPEPVYLLHEAAFCRLQIWTEWEWARLPASVRPFTAEYVPGLGWIGAVPIAILN
jgi:hypothetical protein